MCGTFSLGWAAVQIQKRDGGGGGGGVFTASTFYGFFEIQRLCTHSSPWFAVAKIITTDKPSNSGVLIKFVLYRN